MKITMCYLHCIGTGTGTGNRTGTRIGTGNRTVTGNRYRDWDRCREWDQDSYREYVQRMGQVQGMGPGPEQVHRMAP